MKRVKAACILQTLVFAQKPDLGLSKEQLLKINREEIERYKPNMERVKTRYLIEDTALSSGLLTPAYCMAKANHGTRDICALTIEK